MGDSNKAVRIGVIAEEKNDIEVIYELTRKLVDENLFSFSHFVGHGCGKIRRKCAAWGRNLLERGCAHLVVVHDLDRHDEVKLRQLLENEIKEIGFDHKVVLIPIEEIEAWLLCDPIALKSVFRMGKVPKLPAEPEKIGSPKEYLSNIVKKNSKTQYLNTIHNRRIAAEIGIANCKRRCPSFSRYPKFIKMVFAGT